MISSAFTTTTIATTIIIISTNTIITTTIITIITIISLKIELIEFEYVRENHAPSLDDPYIVLQSIYNPMPGLSYYHHYYHQYY
jgi:hypothetical protein